MIDFPLIERATTTMILWCCFLYIYVIKKQYKRTLYRPISKDYSRLVPPSMLALFLFAVTCFTDGDFFHSIDFVQSMKSISYITDGIHYEKVYQYLAVYVGANYLLWRIVIWGSAVLLICLTSKRLKLNIQLVGLLLFIIFANDIGYSRSTLAQSIYFFGLSFLIVPLKNGPRILSFIIGLGIIYLATIFHKSMWLLVGTTFVIFTPNIYNKKGKLTFFLYIAFLIFATYLASKTMFMLDVEAFTGDEKTAVSLQRYSERVIGDIGVNSMLRRYLSILRNAIFFYYIYVKVFERKLQVDNLQENLIKIALCIIVVGYTFDLLGTQFYTISYRYLIMLQIPIVLLLVHLYQKGILSNKNMKTIMILCSLLLINRLLYQFFMSTL